MALREVGIDIGDEATSTDLKRHPEMLEQTDLIIAMTEKQASELVERFPGAKERPVFTLRSFAGEAGDINDPYEQGDQVFAQCREEIHRLVPTIIERLFHP
jgi:protein-tyrosine-phosphatase